MTFRLWVVMIGKSWMNHDRYMLLLFPGSGKTTGTSSSDYSTVLKGDKFIMMHIQATVKTKREKRVKEETQNATSYSEDAIPTALCMH